MAQSVWVELALQLTWEMPCATPAVPAGNATEGMLRGLTWSQAKALLSHFLTKGQEGEASLQQEDVKWCQVPSGKD